MKKISVHSLQAVRSFAENHSVHKLSLKKSNKNANASFKIRTSSKPFPETFAYYEAELFDGEYSLLKGFVVTVLQKCFTKKSIKLSIEELNKVIDFIETNMYQDVCLDQPMLTDKMRDGFDFVVGQIIVLGCSVEDGGNNEFELPAIVTKIHPRDINEHYQYDFIFPLRGACEFVSWGKDEKRYLWRFHRKEVVRPPTWFLDGFLKETSNCFTVADCDLVLDNLFYIDKNVDKKEDMKLIYPFRYEGKK
jgi:hypothetical protein